MITPDDMLQSSPNEQKRTDYKLLRALLNVSDGKTFATVDELKTAFDDIFDSRPAEFYKGWKQVIYSNGYIFLLFPCIVV